MRSFLYTLSLPLRNQLDFTYDNALDVIAIGFDPKRTVILSDVKHIDAQYEIAIQVAKRVTYSTVKAVFGFEDSSNIGIIFFPAIQAVPAFWNRRSPAKTCPA